MSGAPYHSFITHPTNYVIFMHDENRFVQYGGVAQVAHKEHAIPRLNILALWTRGNDHAGVLSVRISGARWPIDVAGATVVAIDRRQYLIFLDLIYDALDNDPLTKGFNLYLRS
jgi:hypothetical protein